MLRPLRPILRDRAGVTALEYAMMALGFVMAGGAVFNALGPNLKEILAHFGLGH
jgi:hypothetical protein